MNIPIFLSSDNNYAPFVATTIASICDNTKSFCDFYVLDDFCLGNLNEVRLNEIYKKRDEIKFIERSMNHPEECKKCRWFKLCRGGCYRSRITEQGDEKCWNYFCPGYKYFFDTCHKKLEDAAGIVWKKMHDN